MQNVSNGVTQIVAAAESVPSYQVNILTGAEAEAAEDLSAAPPLSGDGTSK